MKVVIVGSGNVATVLGGKIKDCGFKIAQVISRNERTGSQLANVLNSSFSCNILEINSNSDLWLIAVPDQQIELIAATLPKTENIIVHTAGSVNKNVLSQVSLNYGVLYPLQTLNKESDSLPLIPVLIDSSTENVKDALYDFACKWSPIVTFADDEKRLKTHVAAVIANNFTNHLMALTEKFCYKEGVDFNMLFPLILETVNNLGKMSPSRLQTGPAVRGDQETIHKHLQLLANEPALHQLYQALSESISKHRDD